MFLISIAKERKYRFQGCFYDFRSNLWNHTIVERDPSTILIDWIDDIIIQNEICKLHTSRSSLISLKDFLNAHVLDEFIKHLVYGDKIFHIGPSLDFFLLIETSLAPN